MFGTPAIAVAQIADSQGAPLTQPKLAVRYGEQALWSSHFFVGTSAVANGTFPLFSVGFQQQGQGFARAMTIAETNLRTGGKIPNGRAYDVYAVTGEFMKHNAAGDTGSTNGAIDTLAEVEDLLNFINNCALAWRFNQAVIDIAPLSLVGAGGGAFGAVSTTVNNTSVGHMNNGPGTAWLYQASPVSLPGAVTFQMQLRFGLRAAAVAALGAIVRVSLIGYYRSVIDVG